MTKELFALNVTKNAATLVLFFETYETLLSAKALLVGIDGLAVQEDTAHRQCFMIPSKALDFVALWAASVDGQPVAAVKQAAARVKPAPVVIHRPVVNAEPGKTRHDQILEMLQKPRGVSLAEVAERFQIRPASASALISVATRKHGFRATLKDGRYTAAKIRKRGAPSGRRQSAGGTAEVAGETRQ